MCFFLSIPRFKKLTCFQFFATCGKILSMEQLKKLPVFHYGKVERLLYFQPGAFVDGKQKAFDAKFSQHNGDKENMKNQPLFEGGCGHSGKSISGMCDAFGSAFVFCLIIIFISLISTLILE